MKFRVPKSFECGPMTIEVLFTDVDEDEFGEFRYDKARVLIDKRFKGKDQAIEIFAHEVVEAANLLYELNLPHRTIQTLGAAFAQMIKSSR